MRLCLSTGYYLHTCLLSQCRFCCSRNGRIDKLLFFFNRYTCLCVCVCQPDTIYVHVYLCKVLFVAAEMAEMWEAVKMLAIISALQILAYNTATGHPLLPSSETYGDISTSDHTRDMARDKPCTGVSFAKNLCSPSLMLDETIDILKKLFRIIHRRQQKTTTKHTSAVVRTRKEKRYSSWFARPRIFRSDLGKRSIRTSSDRSWLTRSNRQN